MYCCLIMATYCTLLWQNWSVYKLHTLQLSFITPPPQLINYLIPQDNHQRLWGKYSNYLDACSLSTSTLRQLTRSRTPPRQLPNSLLLSYTYSNSYTMYFTDIPLYSGPDCPEPVSLPSSNLPWFTLAHHVNTVPLQVSQHKRRQLL